jgi:hypothetical protein
MDKQAELFLQGVASVEQAVEGVRADTAAHVNELHRLWTLGVYEAGLSYLGRKRVCNNGAWRSWYTAELGVLRTKVDRLRVAIQKARADPAVPAAHCDHLWASYAEAQNAHREAYRRLKAGDEQRLNAELVEARSRGDSRQFWAMLKQRRGFFEAKDTPTVVQDEKRNLCVGRDAANVWQRLYQRIGNARDDAEDSIEPSRPLDERFRLSVEAKLKQLFEQMQGNSELDAPFSMAEMVKAIAGLKRNVAAGPDMIPNEWLQAMGAAAKEALLLLFNRTLQSGVWPDAWQLGTILPLFKGGNRAAVGDYRPITLTSCVSKLFESLLLVRLTALCEGREVLVEEQGGFRAGRSTLDQIFTLHEIVASRKERKLATYMAFLDARRAYDRVWRDGLLLRLLEAGVTGQVFKLLRSMLTASKRRVVVGGESSDSFETTVGLPQGAVLSPLLYAIFINGLAVELKQRRFGVDVFGRQVCILLYADDIVLIADSPAQLQQMLDHTARYAQQWQFRFNTKPGKSDVVVSGSRSQCAQPLPQFRLGEGLLRVSRQYKYLGVEMGQIGRGAWNTYLDRAAENADHVMKELLYSVTGRSQLHLTTAVHLFETLVRPRMEYADAIWGAMCSASALRQLEAVQERFGRRILRVSKSIAGEYVRRELGLESMQQRVEVAMLRFFGRLSVMPNSRLAGFIFRQRCAQVDAGRGKLSWCVNVKKKLVELNHGDVWAARRVPEIPDESDEAEQTPEKRLNHWRAAVKRELGAQFQRESQRAMEQLSSLSLFRRLGPAKLKGWLDFAVRHPGASLRLKLRCGAAPLMEAVGGSAHMPRHERLCRICGSGAVESAQHFVSQCPAYAAERQECLRRVAALAGRRPSPEMRRAIDTADVELFLGDRLLRRLPQEVALKVDATVCNFLRIAWRKRQPLWRNFCQDGTEWRLR